MPALSLQQLDEVAASAPVLQLRTSGTWKKRTGYHTFPFTIKRDPGSCQRHSLLLPPRLLPGKFKVDQQDVNDGGNVLVSSLLRQQSAADRPYLGGEPPAFECLHAGLPQCCRPSLPAAAVKPPDL